MSIILDFNGSKGAASPVSRYGFIIVLNSGQFTENGFSGNPLFIGNANAQATLLRADGGAFDFSAIDFAAGDPAINVTFVASNGQSSTYQTSSPPSSLETHQLSPAFENVTSVTWSQGVAGVDAYVFNNLDVNWR